MNDLIKYKTLKITIKNHFASLWTTLLATIMFIYVILYLRYDTVAITIFGVYFLINALPALYLHIEYWLINKDDEYIIRKSEIILRKNGKEYCYKNKDIEKVIFYLTPSLYINSIPFLSMQSYHYAIVKLKNGDEHVLTCLIAPRIDKELKQIVGVLFERRKKMFCSLSQ